MAGSSLYQDGDEARPITDINVTPFVDVVLVLLVVFMVTAKLIVARGVEIDKPKAADRRRGPEHAARVGDKPTASCSSTATSSRDDAAAIARIKEIAATTAEAQGDHRRRSQDARTAA